MVETMPARAKGEGRGDGPSLDRGSVQGRSNTAADAVWPQWIPCAVLKDVPSERHVTHPHKQGRKRWRRRC